MTARGWEQLDILLISGDAYIDHPSFGPAVIGRVLEAAGFRVGVIAQPDWRTPAAIQIMGRPRLFCGVTAGNLDSMLSNYTAARHKRQTDEFSPGGRPGLRPNHACTVYAQLARQSFPGLPVVLGGIEASMRRVAHYDYWEDKLRPSILLSSKAELLVYGMGEAAVLEIARRFSDGPKEGLPDLCGIPGTAVLLGAEASQPFAETAAASATDKSDRYLPAWEELQADAALLLRQTKLVEAEASPLCGRRLIQFYAKRALVVEPPAPPPTKAEFDRIYELPYTRQPHPSYREEIPAFTMIKDSITVVRGCPGGCSFCGLGLHQGKLLASRSRESTLRELSVLTRQKSFRGTVSDLGGPTANLYECRNGHTAACRTCRRPSCLFPALCPHFEINETPGVELLRSAAQTPGVKHVFVQSGIRMDVAARQPALLRELVRKHVSGHLKVAPEHLDPEVLRRMRKPPAQVFLDFLALFEKASSAAGKEQYTVPYFISSFPGCTERHMQTVTRFLEKRRWNLQQVQDFIPLPMTAAGAMYATGLDYETEQPIFVARNAGERLKERRALQPSLKKRGMPSKGARS